MPGGLIGLRDSLTYIDRDDNGDMTFTDTNAGTLTLSQLGSSRGYTEDFTSATSFAVNHALSSTAVIVQVYDTGTNQLLIPDTITIDDANNVTVTISIATAVRVSVTSIN